MKLEDLYLANSSWEPDTRVHIYDYHNADAVYFGDINKSIIKYGEMTVRTFLNNTIYIDMEVNNMPKAGYEYVKEEQRHGRQIQLSELFEAMLYYKDFTPLKLVYNGIPVHNEHRADFKLSIITFIDLNKDGSYEVWLAD